MTKLDRCWKNCLRMWKWVAETYDGTREVAWLKSEWLNHHRFRNVEVNCFFCQWNEAHGGGVYEHRGTTICKNCPAVYVQKSFCCQSYHTYDYAVNPKAFYAKLLKLDAIRKK